MTAGNPVQAGDHVTAAYRGGHVGLVLAFDDPHAWTDTLAFPGRTPSRHEVRAHLVNCTARGLSFATRVPVYWCFGTTDWERVAGLARGSGAPCRCRLGHGG